MSKLFPYLNLNEITSVFKEKKIYFDKLTGNNGDILIKLGTQKYLEDRAINLVHDPESADVIFVCGGGWLTYKEDIPIYESEQTRMLIQYPRKTVVIFPSSINQSSVASLQEIFSRRTAETFIFARDLKTYELIEPLQSISGIRIGIDHDLAFNLIDSDFIKDLRVKSVKEHILIVERFDVEGATIKPLPYRISENIRANIPKFIKTRLKSSVGKVIYSSSPFARKIKKLVDEEYSSQSGSPYFINDISLPHNFSFDEFTNIISKSSLVFTTRLHVGILAAMLNKEIIIVSAKTHKYQGCFDYSIKNNFENCQLIQLS